MHIRKNEIIGDECRDYINPGGHSFVITLR